MLMQNPHAALVARMRAPRATRAVRKVRFQESPGTMALGGLSTSIGVILLIVLSAGIAGWPIGGWNERAANAAREYFVPSRECAIAAMVGVVLGLAGVALARSCRRPLSPISLIGTAICFLDVALFFLYVSVQELS